LRLNLKNLENEATNIFEV